MPPTRVLISTCLSCPLPSFFTFTLQPDNSKAVKTVTAAAITNALDLFLSMLISSTGHSERTLDASASLRDVGNTHGKMAMNRDFPKQRFDRACLRYRRIGIRTHIILNLRKVGGKIRIPHGDHRSLLRR